jgi:hypothetical protein
MGFHIGKDSRQQFQPLLISGAIGRFHCVVERWPHSVHRLTPPSSLCIFIVETQGGAKMHVRVQKWGNSLAVRIPKPLAEDAEVKEGTVLNLAVSDGKVVASGRPKDLEASSSGIVCQFIGGHADGPVPFHYPAPDYHEQLLSDETFT